MDWQNPAKMNISIVDDEPVFFRSAEHVAKEHG